MDDLEIIANPEYLEVSTHLKKTTENGNIMSMEIDLKKDVKSSLSKVILFLKSNGEYQEIYKVSEEQCCNVEGKKKKKRDELIQYSLNLIEKFGDLKISSCPIKMVIIEKKLKSLV